MSFNQTFYGMNNQAIQMQLLQQQQIQNNSCNNNNNFINNVSNYQYNNNNNSNLNQIRSNIQLNQYQQQQLRQMQQQYIKQQQQQYNRYQQMQQQQQLQQQQYLLAQQQQQRQQQQAQLQRQQIALMQQQQQQMQQQMNQQRQRQFEQMQRQKIQQFQQMQQQQQQQQLRSMIQSQCNQRINNHRNNNHKKSYTNNTNNNIHNNHQHTNNNNNSNRYDAAYNSSSSSLHITNNYKQQARSPSPLSARSSSPSSAASRHDTESKGNESPSSCALSVASRSGDEEESDGHHNIHKSEVFPYNKQSSSSLTKLKACLRWIIYHDQIDDYADMLCTNDELKIHVINQCSKHSATHSACIKWAKKWNLINNIQCKRSIYYAMSQSKSNNKSAANNNNNHNGNNDNHDGDNKKIVSGFDDLEVCTIDVVNDVLFVNNQLTFNMAKSILLNEKNYIGLDLECMVKQFPIKNAPKYCQILQVATSTKTLIFDLEAIRSKYDTTTKCNESNADEIDVTEFDQILHQIFYDSNIIKIGMSFDSDLKLLRKQYPYLKCFKCIIKSYFELEKLLNFMRTKQGQQLFDIDLVKEDLIKSKLNKTNTKREGGLPTIVRHILNQRLIKKEQLSNWARRPLRISQLQYAAIDAKIQLDIYDKLITDYSDLLKNNRNQWIYDLTRY